MFLYRIPFSYINDNLRLFSVCCLDSYVFKYPLSEMPFLYPSHNVGIDCTAGLMSRR